MKEQTTILVLLGMCWKMRCLKRIQWIRYLSRQAMLLWRRSQKKLLPGMEYPMIPVKGICWNRLRIVPQECSNLEFGEVK